MAGGVGVGILLWWNPQLHLPTMRIVPGWLEGLIFGKSLDGYAWAFTVLIACSLDDLSTFPVLV